jgi:hypothetical protein
MADTEPLGPISYLIVEFPGNKMTGEGFPILVDLVDRGLIRILDLAFVTRDDDGTVRAIDLSDIDGDGRDPGLREPLGDRVRPGAAAQRRPAGRGRLHPPGRAARVARRDRALTAEKGPPMPGLLRGVARTAVVAGTATAVSNRVSRRQANRWSQQEDEQYAQQQQQYAQPAPAPVPAPAAPSESSESDMISQLKQLAELKDQGILTEEEFAAQKAKILGT